MDTGTNLTPSNTMDNSIGQVVSFNDPYQEPTDLITAQAGGGQEGQKTPDDVFSADAEHFDDVAPLDGPCLHCGNEMFTEAHKSWFCDRESGGCGIVAHFVNPFEAESFSAESKCEHKNWSIYDYVPEGSHSRYGFQKGSPKHRGLNATAQIICTDCGDHFALLRFDYGGVGRLPSDWFGAESKFKRPYDGRHGFNPKRDTKGRFRRKLVVPLAKGAESLVEEPDWIPAGDGRALGQQNLDINLSPLHAEGNLKDYNPITLVVLGIIGGIGVALGTQSLVK
jgi:hypothetical protein